MWIKPVLLSLARLRRQMLSSQPGSFRRGVWILSLCSTAMGRPKVKQESEKELLALLSDPIDQSLALHHLALKLLKGNKTME